MRMQLIYRWLASCFPPPEKNAAVSFYSLLRRTTRLRLTLCIVVVVYRVWKIICEIIRILPTTLSVPSATAEPPAADEPRLIQKFKAGILVGWLCYLYFYFVLLLYDNCCLQKNEWMNYLYVWHFWLWIPLITPILTSETFIHWTDGGPHSCRHCVV